jgi:signal transduction histidine kinase
MRFLVCIAIFLASTMALAGPLNESIKSVELSPGLRFSSSDAKSFPTLTAAQAFANAKNLNEVTLRINLDMKPADCGLNFPALSFGFIYDQDRTLLNGQLIGSTGSPGLSKRRLSLIPRVYPLPKQVLKCPGMNQVDLSLKRILGGWIGPFAGSIELGELHELQEKALLTEAAGPLFQNYIGILLLAISVLLISLFYRYPDNHKQTAFVAFSLASSLLCLSLSGWYYRYFDFPEIVFRFHFVFISVALTTQTIFIAAYRDMKWANAVSKRLAFLGAFALFTAESFSVSSVGTLLNVYLFQLLVLITASWAAYLAPLLSLKKFAATERNYVIEASLFIIHFGCSMDIARIWKLHNFENISPYTYGFSIFVIGSQLASELVKVFQRAAQTAEAQARLRQSERQSEFARQVGHDIRSPLAALNMVVAAVKGVPEEQRLVMRSAAKRINDIANSLLDRSWLNEISEESKDGGMQGAEGSVVMLSSLVDSIVSEKRVQYRDRHEVDIEVDLSRGYGLFSRIRPADVSRAISNLIDNSVEATRGSSARILVLIEENGEKNRIIVRDNGRGIPKEILGHLGVKGASFGKNKGSGLGLHQARSSAEALGGSLTIESEVGRGTIVTLALPACDAPTWFLERLEVSEQTILISVDDDSTVHQIWESRLSTMTNQCVEHMAFTSIAHFEQWFRSNRAPDAKFLVDYEFLGHSENGLHMIERLNLVHQAILVSSRAEDKAVQERALGLGLKLLPKSLAALIPIEIKATKAALSLV